MLRTVFRREAMAAMTLLAGLATTHASGQIIDFETLPDGSTPTDNTSLDRNTPYVIDGVEVRIGFDADRNGTVETNGVIEAVGQDGTDGFYNSGMNSNDVADLGFEQQLGDWFLRSVNAIGGDPGILVLTYSEPVTAMSGEIWDIDGGQTTEAWLIRAKDMNGTVVASLRSPEFSHQGPTSFDGQPWIFSVVEPGGFVRIEIEFDGTRTDGIGLAFNNYNATTSLAGPRLIAHDPSTPNSIFRSPGGTDVVRLIWSEAVSIDETDVEITDASAQSVSFTLSGSDSQVTVLEFAQPFMNDTYTFTIHDTAVATANNAPIDGDDDGVAGGDGVFQLQHITCSADLDGDGDVDVDDYILFELLFTGPF